MDWDIRYVGKTVVSDTLRLKQHVAESLRGVKTHKCDWIRSLIKVGLYPEIEIMYSGDGDWKEHEIDLIRYCRLTGHPLTNLTDGGEGGSGIITTEQQRAALSARSKARWADPAYREKALAALRKAGKDPESRARRSVAAKSSSNRPEVKAKISQAQKEKWSDPEYKQNMIILLSDARQGQEYKQRFSEAISKSQRTQEARDRSSKRFKEMWENNREDIVASLKKSWEDPDSRISRIAANRASKDSPEFRLKMSEISKIREAKKKAERESRNAEINAPKP